MNKLLLVLLFVTTTSHAFVTTHDEVLFDGQISPYTTANIDLGSIRAGDPLPPSSGITVFQPGVSGNSSVITDINDNHYLGRIDTLGNTNPFGIGQQIIFTAPNIRGVGFNMFRPDGTLGSTNAQTFDYNDVEFFIDGVAIALPTTTVTGDSSGVYFGILDLDATHSAIAVRFNNEYSLGYINGITLVSGARVGSVPEPGILLLFALGLLGIAFVSKR